MSDELIICLLEDISYIPSGISSFILFMSLTQNYRKFPKIQCSPPSKKLFQSPCSTNDSPLRRIHYQSLASMLGSNYIYNAFQNKLIAALLSPIWKYNIPNSLQASKLSINRILMVNNITYNISLKKCILICKLFTSIQEEDTQEFLYCFLMLMFFELLFGNFKFLSYLVLNYIPIGTPLFNLLICFLSQFHINYF